MILKAPCVAIVHMTPFQVGALVKKEDTVILLECMKTLIDVTAKIEGTIKEIFVTPGDLVEAGDPLVEISEGLT
jgi:biotin carboxyl carrier protein